MAFVTFGTSNNSAHCGMSCLRTAYVTFTYPMRHAHDLCGMCLACACCLAYIAVGSCIRAGFFLHCACSFMCCVCTRTCLFPQAARVVSVRDFKKKRWFGRSLRHFKRRFALGRPGSRRWSFHGSWCLGVELAALNGFPPRKLQETLFLATAHKTKN